MKFKVNDKVKVVDIGFQYDWYDEWFEKNNVNKDLLQAYMQNVTTDFEGDIVSCDPSVYETYTVMATGISLDRFNNEHNLYVIQGEDGKVWLYGEEGLK